MNKKANNNINLKKLLLIHASKKPARLAFLISFLAVAAIVAVFSINKNNKAGSKASGENTALGGNQSAAGAFAEFPVTKDSDIVISIKDVTENPSFYPANINGTDLEVIAVRASDGTIRTVFNTCQVCYSSGKGYYNAEGDELVCQNCGNRFGIENVEVTRGGCNPVPITSEYKTVDDETIMIPKDFLTDAAVIFRNWK